MPSLPIRDYVNQLPILETGAAVYAELARRKIEIVARLNSNEGPYPPFPDALEAIKKASTDLNRYPHPTGGPLPDDLARMHGIPRDHVVVSGGSTMLLFLLAAALLEPDDEMVYPWPAYPQYGNAAKHHRARGVRVPLTDLTVDLDAILAAITPRTKLVIVPNPNNPTGTALKRGALARFLERLPPGIVAAVDEAYAEFADDYESAIPHVRAGAPIIVLRTFSKIYGLAGAPLGYGLGPPDLIRALEVLRPPFSITHIAMVAGHASLARPDLVAERARLNASERDKLCAAFRRLGLTYAPSSANFVLVDIGSDSREVFERLLTEGVLVRSGRGYDLPNHLRVTIGLPEENARFIQALERALAPKKT